MKNLKLTLVTLLTGAAFALTSCNSDPCEKTTCQNGGAATASTDNKSCSCKCATGYSGSDCATELVTALSGTYSASETGSASGTSSFTLGLSKVSTTSFKLSGFYGPATAGGFVNPVTVTLTDNSNFTIARQQPDANQIYVAGTGKITTNSAGKYVFTVTYSASDESSSPIVTDNVTSTMTQL